MRSKIERWVITSFVSSFFLLSVSYVAALDTGTRAPDITLNDLSGNKVQLSQTRGKVVIVDFWASWCEPCKSALPALDRIYRRYKDHGLVVIGVSVDRDEDSARGFLKKTPVTFPVVHDARGRAVANRYSPPTMPSSFVIDKQGKVHHIHAGFRDGDAAKIEKLIRGLL